MSGGEWTQGEMHASRVRQMGWVQLNPTEVIFKDVELDVLYMLRLNIKNVDNRVHSVRVVPPRSNDFQVVFVPTAPIAPGLDMTCEIEFRARSERDYHDFIVIESEDDSIQVPLHAFVPRPELEMDRCVAPSPRGARLRHIPRCAAAAAALCTCAATGAALRRAAGAARRPARGSWAAHTVPAGARAAASWISAWWRSVRPTASRCS